MPASTIAHTNEKIILVNPNDEKIGEIEKILAHEYGMLHRAFSVFIFRYHQSELQCLLQQRSKQKYHCAGLWSNACCSHPHANETTQTAAIKRLKMEMGIQTSLKEIGKFHYIAQFDNGLTENEIDHVFIGIYDQDPISVNKEEVENYQWLTVKTLIKELKAEPKKYTPWLEESLELALKAFNQEEIKC